MSMGYIPNREELMVVGDVNKDIADPEGNTRNEAIMPSLVDAGIGYISSNSLLYRTPWAQDGQTWSMIWQEK